jgi:hypothetical protein
MNAAAQTEPSGASQASQGGKARRPDGRKPATIAGKDCEPVRKDRSAWFWRSTAAPLRPGVSDGRPRAEQCMNRAFYCLLRERRSGKDPCSGTACHDRRISSQYDPASQARHQLQR